MQWNDPPGFIVLEVVVVVVAGGAGYRTYSATHAKHMCHCWATPPTLSPIVALAAEIACFSFLAAIPASPFTLET